VNLGQLRLHVAQALNVANGANVNTIAGAERTLLDEYLNEGVEQILLRTKVNKKTASIALTSGVGDYTVDPIMLAFDDAWITPGASVGWNPMLERVDSYDIRQMRQAVGSVASPSQYYAFEGNVIMLYPSPATGDTMHIVYTPRPSAMTSTGNDPSVSPYGEIPSEFHWIIEQYGLWKMADYADDGSSQVGQTYTSGFERGISQMKMLLNKKAGVRSGRASTSRRNRSGFRAPPGVDVRYG
jgi:hypothetical protein